jgi:hypothetical protein
MLERIWPVPAKVRKRPSESAIVAPRSSLRERARVEFIGSPYRPLSRRARARVLARGRTLLASSLSPRRAGARDLAAEAARHGPLAPHRAHAPSAHGEELKIIYTSLYMKTPSSAARRPSSSSFRYSPGLHPARATAGPTAPRPCSQ